MQREEAMTVCQAARECGMTASVVYSGARASYGVAVGNTQKLNIPHVYWEPMTRDEVARLPRLWTTEGRPIDGEFRISTRRAARLVRMLTHLGFGVELLELVGDDEGDCAVLCTDSGYLCEGDLLAEDALIGFLEQLVIPSWEDYSGCDDCTEWDACSHCADA